MFAHLILYLSHKRWDKTKPIQYKKEWQFDYYWPLYIATYWSLFWIKFLLAVHIVFSFIKAFNVFSDNKPWSLSLLSQNKCPNPSCHSALCWTDSSASMSFLYQGAQKEDADSHNSPGYSLPFCSNDCKVLPAFMVLHLTIIMHILFKYKQSRVPCVTYLSLYHLKNKSGFIIPNLLLITLKLKKRWP